MRQAEFVARAEAIAANRTAGASELVAELWPILQDARASGRDAVLGVARIVCRGQPAMAPIWNACAAAFADLASPGRLTRVRAEVERAPRALERAASAALRDAFIDVRVPRILTLSYSASVSRVLQMLASEHPLEIVCAESLPAREGARLYQEVVDAGAHGELVLDAELTTRLPHATAVVVGADALGAESWVNKAGTFGVSAAAWFSHVPVYVICGRYKAQAAALEPLMSPLPAIFERIPASLATLFLTDAGPVGPADLIEVSERFAADVARLQDALMRRSDEV